MLTTKKMFYSALVVIILTISQINGYLINLKPNIRTCFFENIEQGGKLLISYEVDPASPGLVTLDGYNPSGQPILNAKPEKYGRRTIQALTKGKHHYCFTSDSDEMLEFSIIGSNYAEKTSNDELAVELQQLKMALGAIRDEQSFHIRREEVHNKISKKINNYVLFWCIFQYLIILAVYLWQIYYVRKLFKVKK